MARIDVENFLQAYATSSTIQSDYASNRLTAVQTHAPNATAEEHKLLVRGDAHEIRSYLKDSAPCRRNRDWPIDVSVRSSSSNRSGRPRSTSGQTTRYSGRCRAVTRSRPRRGWPRESARPLRFRVPDAREVVFEDAVRGVVRFNTDAIGDPVIVRSDGMPAYNFAVVIDDASMGVTHVIRGEDHISNTPRQLLLYEAFGFAPPTFAHLALVMGPDHSPLSKRHGATSVAEFRGQGLSA